MNPNLFVFQNRVLNHRGGEKFTQFNPSPSCIKVLSDAVSPFNLGSIKFHQELAPNKSSLPLTTGVSNTSEKKPQKVEKKGVIT